MEDVLDLYAADHPADEPLIAMDEASKQLLRGAHESLPLAAGRPEREDPVRGWRRVSCRDSRTRLDWAHEVRRLLDEDLPGAKKVKLVCDNLNTHHVGSLYAAFPPEEAHRLARRLEIHYTPRSGSWLNVAEIELSALARQCLDRRIGSAAELASEVAAWARDRNEDASGVVWRFTTTDARVKLRHLYPQV
jgi:hypothetical protein